jgi:hypothetical protein
MRTAAESACDAVSMTYRIQPTFDAVEKKCGIRRDAGAPRLAQTRKKTIGQGILGKRDLMIQEIPVEPAEILDIGAQSDETAAELEVAVDPARGSGDGRFVRQMLDAFADEDDVQRVFPDAVPRFKAVMEKELHIGGKLVPSRGINVHGKAVRARTALMNSPYPQPRSSTTAPGAMKRDRKLETRTPHTERR